MRRLAGLEVRILRIVAERVVLEQVPDDVDAKAIDAAPQPEPHDVVNCGAYLGIAPVEVGLRRQERVVIILAGVRFERPGAAAELGQPVVRRPAVRRRIPPDVPLSLGV